MRRRGVSTLRAGPQLISALSRPSSVLWFGTHSRLESGSWPRNDGAASTHRVATAKPKGMPRGRAVALQPAMPPHHDEDGDPHRKHPRARLATPNDAQPTAKSR